MVRFRLLLLLLLFQTFSFHLKAQNKGFFRQVWLEDGLSQSSVTAITQDENGYIWFGTQDGLNRYDGKQIDQYNFQPFNTNSISGDQIMNLYPGKNNKLWILSTTGLDLMDLTTGINRNLSSEKDFNGNEKSYTPYRIWVLNDVTYLYGNGSFERLILKENKFIREKFLHSKDYEKVIVYSMCLAPSGLYASTNVGIFQVDTLNKTYDKVSGLDFSSRGLNMTSYQDKLIFTDKCDLFMYNTSNGKLFKKNISNDIGALITCAFVDNRGTLWTGTTEKGIYTFRFEGDELKEEQHFIDEPGDRFSLKCNSITCFFQGNDKKEDIIWIGTRDAGAVNYSYSRNAFTLHSQSLSKNINFFGTVKDRKNVIYSGTNSGLHILAPGKNPVFLDIPIENPFAQRPVEAIYCDSKDRVWLGINKSLCKVENNKLVKVKEDVFNNPKTHIMEINEYAEDVLILGTNTGLILYDIIKDKLAPCPIGLPMHAEMNPVPGPIFTDKKKQIWIGTTSGLFCFAGNKLKYHFANDASNQKSLLADAIMDINETESNEILVATTKGLSILVPSGDNYKIENYYKPEGLSNNFLYSIIPDQQGSFWISTNYGICRFDPVKRNFRSYHAADGLFINEFNSGGAYVAADGELIFGGLGGLIGFYPDKLPVTKIPPRLLLRSVTVNQNSLIGDLRNELAELSYDKNNIQLEFSVIDFSTDGRKKLIYKLNDDQQWTIVSGTNTISLANLAPGNYRIYVKAANRDGLESDLPMKIEFTITPPYYQTWWFYSMIAGLAGITAWLIYRAKLKQKIFAIQERERIREEENEKLRKNAALDLHDEFGNGLTRISMLVELTRMKLSDVNPDASKLLDIISDNSTRLYNGTKDYIWSINSASDNLYEVIIRIKDFGDELFYERGIRFNVTGLNDDLRQMKQVPGTGRNVAMIFKEALSNIVKHSNATEVTLIVEHSVSGVCLKLKDNGCGFNTDVTKSGFGLGNMKQRASRIKGEFYVQSEKGAGSEIALTLKEYR